MLSFRKSLCDALLRSHLRVAREMLLPELREPAIVFAPHPDDECIACGGTIRKKVESGASVTIVFMTDGSRSHAHIMDRQELRLIRQGEALAAAAVLGVTSSNVVFLDYEDSKLSEGTADAVEKVRELLARSPARQLFIPHLHDGHADHEATNRIVWAAARDKGLTVFEYTVYLWTLWPWQSAKVSLQGPLNTALFLMQFRDFVNVRAQQERKRLALAEHRSQMTPLVDDPRWWTITQWGDGEFLERVCAGHELFRRRVA